MKQLFIISFLFAAVISAMGQDNPDVYFDKSFKKNKPRIVNLANQEVSQRKLYFGLEAEFKIGSTTLDNSMGGLLAKSNNNSDVVWGATLGYNSDNKWALELAYSPVPIETVLLLNTGRGVGTFIGGTTLQSFPLRFKKNIFNIDKDTKTASVWLSGGLIISPNSRNATSQADTLGSGKINIVRDASNNVTSFDTVRVVNSSRLQNKGLAQFELGIELLGKIAEGFYINLFGRAIIGQNAIVKNEVNYSINSKILSTSNLTSNGFYYTFGLGFRYDFEKHIKYKSKFDE